MENNNSNYLISYRTLRQLIGVLGILLPFLCWFVNAFVNHFGLLNNPFFVDMAQTAIYTPGTDLKGSISDFYYTAAGPLFTGILVTVAIFLFCYTGYPEDKADDRYPWLTDVRVTSFAAICLLGVVVLPTSSTEKITDNIHIFVSSKIAGTLHLCFAELFFLSMAIMSLINFRRHPGKTLINDATGKLYRICGWGIISCLLILGINQLMDNSGHWLWGKFVFIMETVMLLFFGTAWLVKGESIPTQFLLHKLSDNTSQK